LHLRRPPETFTIAKGVYIGMDNNAPQAGDRIADALKRRYRYFGLTNLAAVAVAGTLDDCIAGLREVAAFQLGLSVIGLHWTGGWNLALRAEVPSRDHAPA
jgi:hypothetical protein